LRLLFIAVAAASSAYAAAPAAAQAPSRSQLDCVVRAFPAPLRAQFHRQYAEDAEAAIQLLLRPEADEALARCVDRALREGTAEAAEHGELLDQAWRSRELMTASQAIIASIDPGHAGNLEAAFGRLTAAERAALANDEEELSPEIYAAMERFAFLVSPALTMTALERNGRLLEHLTVYASGRALLETIVPAR